MSKLELQIAWMYLRSRRGSKLLSLISIIAIGGVLVGVSALIINKVAVFMFALPWRVQLNKVTVFIVGGSLSTTGDVGIYDLNGNRLAYTGGFSTAGSALLSYPLLNGPITLNSGFYYFAQTCSSTVPTASGFSLTAAASIFVAAASFLAVRASRSVMQCAIPIK